MKNQFKCFMLLVLAFITSSWLLPATAHPTATGKTCHVSVDQSSIVSDVHQLAVVGGDVLYVPPCYATSNTANTSNSKGNGFDYAILPGYYVEMKLYSWYVPRSIGKPLTKSVGSINWQSKNFLRTDHDKI